MIRTASHWACLLLAFLVVTPVLAEAPAVGQRTETSKELAWMFEGKAPSSLADLKAMEKHVQALCETLSDCTVGVRVGGASGSGVIISKEGLVLTAGHVSGTPGREARIIMPDGTSLAAITLGANRGIDSGMLKITKEGEYPFAPIGESGTLNRGDWCLCLGHPGGFVREREPVVRWGRVLSNRNSAITTDCLLVGGDSGGPLFDMHGRVIGIHSRIGGSLIANMHVPVDTYRDTWDRLAASEAWGGGNAPVGPYIGVQGDPEVDIARIVGVLPDSPAAKAGILAGDVIVKFNEDDITDFESLANFVRKCKAGDKVKIAVQRGEDVVELEIEIASRD